MNRDFFQDEKNEIYWERYDMTNPNSFQKYNDIINSWSSDSAIQKFIHFDEPVANALIAYIESDYEDKENMYYAFVEGKLAGVVYITAPGDDVDDETYLEYLIVNPNMKGKGIGTRLVSSIKSNPTFFAENHHGRISASVEHTNEASKRVFIKNGFVMCKPMSDESLSVLGLERLTGLESKFGRWFFCERENVEEENVKDVDNENECYTI